MNRALNAVQKTGDELTGNIGLKNDGRMHFYIADDNGNVRMWFYKDKGGDGVCITNGYDGGGVFVLRKDGGMTLGSGAQIAPNGDVYGGVWGSQWISTWLNNCFATRDTNINTRATWDWVSQNFASGFRLGAVETAQIWRAAGYGDQPPYVITGVTNPDGNDVVDYVQRRPLQMNINGWRNIDWL
ncbi:hypothetical protein JS958_001298 [Salmonella enterica subsp. enterica serovar Infantis]|nr:hypothetical protein [Salmonella enterica subsp. enterica serovar Javiana]EDA8690974.1 hypothetical protein [Salmonella enterica subsp. enterica serovar Newport]EGR7980913.1 hypothetical protein [Salmonella enterica subsp. enterica serovar Infantis]EJW4857402.1 hypothetical protein [Salmonella enterica]EHC4523540.1 hypothetical protein [Salmonella enterica subsp. enterica serovar Infantis]